MLQLITLPIIATCNIIVNQFLAVFSKVHNLFAFLQHFCHIRALFFCQLFSKDSSHKIITFCNILKYLVHDIESHILVIQYIEIRPQHYNKHFIFFT